MAKRNQATEAHAEKRPKVESDVTSKLDRDLISQPELLSGPISAARGGAIQAQAALVGDARLQTVQRQAMAMQIRDVQGNQHLQRVMASMKCAEDTTEPTPVPVTQQLQVPTVSLTRITDPSEAAEAEAEAAAQAIVSGKEVTIKPRADLAGAIARWPPDPITLENCMRIVRSAQQTWVRDVHPHVVEARDHIVQSPPWYDAALSSVTRALAAISRGHFDLPGPVMMSIDLTRDYLISAESRLSASMGSPPEIPWIPVRRRLAHSAFGGVRSQFLRAQARSERRRYGDALRICRRARGQLLQLLRRPGVRADFPYYSLRRRNLLSAVDDLIAALTIASLPRGARARRGLVLSPLREATGLSQGALSDFRRLVDEDLPAAFAGQSP